MSESESGPFGLVMGQDIQTLDVEPIPGGLGDFIIRDVPKPHPTFETYVGKFIGNFGLSWIKALGKDIVTSPYGTEIKSAFSDLSDRLEKVYGKAEISDFLMHDSIWNEPGDWMQGNLNKERYLMADWSAKNGHTLKANLKSVALFAKATDTNMGYLAVEYEFSNNDAAEAEQIAEQDSVL